LIDMHRGRKNLRTVGRCIYCGKTKEQTPENKLTEEHVIPYSLDADVYLEDASCLSCAEITSGIELHVARTILGDHRIHQNVQTRHPKRRPKTLKTRIRQQGIERTEELLIKDHPYFLAMPVWEQPGILRGAKKSREFDGLSAHLYYHVPDNIRETLGLKDGDIAEIKPDTRGDAAQFGRAIAKIAYCNVIGKWGLEAYDFLDMPKLILGEYPFVSHYVGSFLGLPPPPDRRGARHSIEMTAMWAGSPIVRRFMIVQVRLFIGDGVPEHGMPIYTAVVGVPRSPNDEHDSLSV